MATVDITRPGTQPVVATASQADLSITQGWMAPAPPQEAGERRRQEDAAEAAGRRVAAKYPNALRRLSE